MPQEVVVAAAVLVSKHLTSAWIYRIIKALQTFCESKHESLR